MHKHWGWEGESVLARAMDFALIHISSIQAHKPNPMPESVTDVSIPQWFDSSLLIVTPSSNPYSSFNSTMVRFKHDRSTSAVTAREVSIPQWFDSSKIINYNISAVKRFQFHNGSIQARGLSS